MNAQATAMQASQAGSMTSFFTVPSGGGPTLTLKNGEPLEPVTLAYETYGSLAPGRDNAILVFHALSGSQHAAGFNPAVPGVGDRWTEECRIGWWDGFIGPGKALDTNRYFVICANYLGGCYGSTGPATTDPVTGNPYGSLFPGITLSDIVDTQLPLITSFGVERLLAVVGGSLGGLLALNLAVRHPHRVKNVIPIACGPELSILQRIQNFEQIYAIEQDPHFNGGDYYAGACPRKGLALARMIAHKTYVSLRTMDTRARQEVTVPGESLRHYRTAHPVESYMLHQGRRFVERFDANTYLRIMEAWQNFDLVRETGAADLAGVFARCRGQRFLVFSIDSDVCSYPEEQAYLVSLLKRNNIPVRQITVHSEKGHDAFLLEPELLAPYLAYTLKGR